MKYILGYFMILWSCIAYGAEITIVDEEGEPENHIDVKTSRSFKLENFSPGIDCEIDYIDWVITQNGFSNKTETTTGYETQSFEFNNIGDITVKANVYIKDNGDNDGYVCDNGGNPYVTIESFEVQPVVNFTLLGEGSFRINDLIQFDNKTETGDQPSNVDYKWTWYETNKGTQTESYMTSIERADPHEELSGFNGITYSDEGVKTVELEVSFGTISSSLEKTIEIEGPPPLHISDVDLSHFCWDFKKADGTTHDDPAQLEVYAYGGVKPYSYNWETYDYDLDVWVSASTYLDDHTIKIQRSQIILPGTKQATLLFV